MRRKRKSLDHLKHDVEAGDISSSLTFLRENDDPAYLAIFREQKLLFKVQSTRALREFARSYADAAGRLLTNPNEIARINNYVDFAVLSSQLHRKILHRAHRFAEQVRLITGTEFMRAIEEVVEEALVLPLKSFSEGMKKLTLGVDLRPEKISDANSWLLQELTAAFADTSGAGVRALNEFVGYTDFERNSSSDKKHYVKARKAAKALVQASSYLNSLEYISDMISFGEWYVSEITERENVVEVRLDVHDLELFMARRLGLRQILSSELFARRNPRSLELLIYDIALDMVVEAAKYYETETEMVYPPEAEIKSLEVEVTKLLNHICPEDELLIEASGSKRVLIYYLTYVSLLCFSLAAAFVSKHCAKKLRKRLWPAEVRLELIRSTLEKKGFSTTLIEEALNSFIVTLPARSHTDLTKVPFVRIQDRVFNVPSVPGPPWTAVVRATLVKGDRLGKSYGEIAEDFIGEKFRSWGWSVLVTGKKLRRIDGF